MARGALPVALALCLLANAFCLPTDVLRFQRDTNDNFVDLEGANPKETSSSTTDPFDDDDEDFSQPASTSTGGSSNIFSLLKLASALFPSSSGSNSSVKLNKILQNIIARYQQRLRGPIRRQGSNYKINTNNAIELKPALLEKQVNYESEGSSESEHSSSNSSESDENGNASVDNDIKNNNESTDNGDNDNGNSESDDNDETNISSKNRSSNSDSSSEEDNAAEESVETDNGNESAKQSSDSNGSDSEEDDYSDEPPGGDGQGGGILGILAGLSGGENGESDLGSLLAAVSGIVVNLSGDGFDLNSLIASAIGLFAGLLSEGEENPGSVVASYLLTSLDTITGGGAKNNGAFFGNFISKLLKGTSAAGESESSEENSNENKMTMADSAGFIISLLMSILGDMSKGSSGGSSAW